ncbi:MAG: hypothetical protein AVDCRST_MAG28-1516, partial [uncultured Rubrobacteraceae bacterium]
WKARIRQGSREPCRRGARRSGARRSRGGV